MQLRTEDVVWQEIDGELVILDLKRSVYLTTNKTGAVLAQLLTDEHSEDDLAQALVERFGISAEVARTDTRTFVDQLQAKKLLL